MRSRNLLTMAALAWVLGACGGGGGSSGGTPVSPAGGVTSSPAPVLTSIAPAAVTAGGAAFTLTANGSGFAPTSTVNWNGAALTTSFVSDSQLTALVPAVNIGSNGSAQVTVSTPNPGGGTSVAATLDINASNPVPAIVSLSPGSATAGASGFTLVVDGTGFVSASTVNWNGAALSTTYVSDVQLSATVPAADIASSGTAAVTVSSPAPGGGISRTKSFDIAASNPAPTISSLSPSTVTAGSGGFVLTVGGSGFVSGSTVNWNGSALVTAYASSTRLTATVPAADIANAGSASVSVTSPSPGGGTSASLTESITSSNPVPAISSLAPASTTAGGSAFTLTVSGTGFVASSTVNWNGTALTTTFISDAQLTASVPASDIAGAGTASVTVSSPAPGGGSSGASVFTIVSTNPAPTIAGIAPTGATAGGAAFSLTVNGSNFVSTSTVNWNGTALPTTFASASQLSAAVPASDIATAGSANITVTNPAPGGGTSTASTFAISSATASGAAPTNVVATSWPYTALVSFTPPASNGKTITSFTVTAVNAPWITGTAPASPVMAYGGGEGWSGAKYQFTVVANYSDGTVSPASAPSNAVGTSGGGPTNLVYSGGVFYWEGDYSYQGTAAYADTTGDPVGGPYDVMLTSTAQGGWQPWSPGANFDLSPYLYLQFDLKPTVAGEHWSVYFENVGDVYTGATVGVPSDANGTYGPTPVVGQWATYKVPLSGMNVGPGTSNIGIYKFCIKDSVTGVHVFYINNVKFTAN